jgi:alanine-glyoxylate transaminase/serine-glyoxylate transaminase/serine-pyruvate transaminase
VYQALSMPVIGHMDPRFIALMDELKARLRELLDTDNQLTIPLSGTGSSGMETCYVNLIEEGDPVLICINGVFGLRQKDMAQRLGAQVDTVASEWGAPIEPAAIAEKLEHKAYRLVAVVHAETSTGVRNPVEEIGAMVNQTDTLLLVDAVTSLGGMPVSMDSWHIDALFSGAQKCLSCPPGLAPLSMSPRALDRLRNRSRPAPSWYFDLNMITKYWEGAKRVYHHTAPVSMIYALHAALAEIHQEGVETVFARHHRCHRQLVAGLEGLGLSMLVDQRYRLPMLNAVLVPEGVDEAGVRSRLLGEYDIEIGAGLGPLAGKIWRIGLMGHTAREENVERLLEALRVILR